MNLDVLFIHPVVHRKGKILHVVMPVGLFSLASILAGNGIKTKIIHRGLEELLDPGFHLRKTMEKYNPRIVCVSLHWYVHTYEAINIAMTAKSCCGALTVLGGFTASFYDVDILRNFSFVDVIIRGDGEIPLSNLVKNYLSGKDFSDIPNVTFRRNSGIIQNPIGYTNYGLADTPPPDLSQLQNRGKYLKINLSGKSEIPLYAIFDDQAPSGLDLVYFRSCPFQCSYCGGGREPQKRFHGRDRLILMDTKALVEYCKALKKQGVQEIRMAYIPHNGAKEYYLNLFRMLHDQGVTFSARISLWDIPPMEVLNMMRKAFSFITFEISPDSASERVRKKNKGIFYTNKELFDVLEFARDAQLDTQLWFMTGLPGETKEDYQLSLEMAKNLLMENMISEAACFALNIEPGSPIHLEPEKYGIRLFRRSFMDFYKWGEEAASGQKLKHYLGFEKQDLGENEILEMAKHFNKTVREAANFVNEFRMPK